MSHHCKSFRAAFTLFELLAAAALLCVLTACMIPVFGRTQSSSKTVRCVNNLRQLYLGWCQWSQENDGWLLASANISSARPSWMSGTLNFNGANASNYDTNSDLAKSPLWNYLARNPDLVKCPSDASTVVLSSTWNGLPAGSRVPRVRSVSMSIVFGDGFWLFGGTAPTNTWRCYAKACDIVLPAHTFVFTEENASSINDGEFELAWIGNQPNDGPSASTLPSCPASYHNGAGNFSFADGHTETHPWVGSFIRLGNTTGTILLNSADSWVDAHWIAKNATVRW